MDQRPGFDAFLRQRFPQILEKTMEKRRRHMEALHAENT